MPQKPASHIYVYYSPLYDVYNEIYVHYGMALSVLYRDPQCRKVKEKNDCLGDDGMLRNV